MFPEHFHDKVNIVESEDGIRIVEAPIADGIIIVLREDINQKKTIEIKFDEERYTKSEAKIIASNFIEMVDKNLLK